MKTRLIKCAGIIIFVFLLLGNAQANPTPKQNGTAPIVQYLQYLLTHDNDVHYAVTQALSHQKIGSAWHGKTINDLLQFFNNWLIEPIKPYPTRAELVRNLSAYKFYVLINSNPYLRQSSAFMGWLGQFLDARGSFQQTPASAKYLTALMKLPSVHIQDYVVPPGGYHSFNDFFLRKLKSGARPIADINKDTVITSPADCSYDAPTYATPGSPIHVKGDVMYLQELLNGSKYARYFNGGRVLICRLFISDYHHFHSPVNGKIVDAGIVGGLYYFDPFVYQHLYQHRRAYFVFKTPDNGYVAMVPVGQWMVSSLTIDHHVGDNVTKGEELGHFNLGGSLMLIAFQNKFTPINKIIRSPINSQTDVMTTTAGAGPWIKMGEKIGTLDNNDN